MEIALGQIEGKDRFAELYAQHGADALHLAYLLTGSRADAEDLTQEAFIRLLGRFGDLRKQDSFRFYLLKTVANLAKNHFRRNAQDRSHAQPVLDQQPVGSTLEDRDLLTSALRQLPYRQQAALVLRYCVDLSEQQTADILGTSVKAVKSLVRRGLATMRQQEEVRT